MKPIAMLAVLTFAVVLSAQKPAAKAAEPVIVKGVQTFTVLVDNGVYKPAALAVKAGKPVEITFKAGKKMDCGNIVVFKNPKISQTIDDGKSAIVKFTPKTKGKITFGCPMGMYKGEVIVK